MKLWKKVYVLALVIITLCVNLGFLGIISVTYHYMLQAERERCEAEYMILQKNIEADMERIEEAEPWDASFFERYIRAYNNYYESDTKLISMINGKASAEDEQGVNLPQTDGVFIYEGTQTTIYVSQKLSENYPNYRVIMQRTLYDFDTMWNQLQPIYLGGGILLSLGVSCLLAVTVRMLLKPMDELETATKQVQDENWSIRVQIKGNDELAQLGNQFNAMADVIEDNIEKLKQESQKKQELINNLSHEMNTPITSIQGFAEYMQMTDISKEEQEECLNFIVGESRRLKEISSTLLLMADIQKAEEISKENFSLKELCNKLEEIYRRQFGCDANPSSISEKEDIKKQNIQWNVSCEDIQMYGNPILIESLLRNLIINAYRAVCTREDSIWKEERCDVHIKHTILQKFTDTCHTESVSYENEKCIALHVFAKEQHIYIEVKDNGCGIEETHLTHIFEPFYRVDKARSREYGGSGLGLAFCKKIVELHQGEIFVESKLGEGSIFRMIFTII